MELSLKLGYQSCQKIADNHYENFPVASRLLPKKLRAAIYAVYAFARTADDFADEGNLHVATRLAKLNDLHEQLAAIEQQQTSNLQPQMLALADTIEKYKLPIGLFYDLLTAFRQDVLKKRYANFAEVLEYCSYSANPIGRIILYLTSNASQENNLQMSDKICSALQLINMLQDFTLDLLNQDRVYLPQDQLDKFGLNDQNLLLPSNHDNLKKHLQQASQQARELLLQGENLPQQVSKILALELKFIIKSAETILDKIQNNTNIYNRVKLTKFEIFTIFCKVILNG